MCRPFSFQANQQPFEPCVLYVQHQNSALHGTKNTYDSIEFFLANLGPQFGHNQETTNLYDFLIVDLIMDRNLWTPIHCSKCLKKNKATLPNLT